MPAERDGHQDDSAQDLPFQCRISGLRAPVPPMAHALLAEVAATPLRPLPDGPRSR